MTPSSDTGPDIGELHRLIVRLRAPDGCPWDREQTLGDLRAYLLEEAHEVAAAIDAGDLDELAGELGDLLFQVVFIARLGEEAGAFDLARVIDGIRAKMIERHPHVFGDERLEDAAAVRRTWERRKLERRGEDGARRSLLAGVPASLPALTAAYRITQKAAGVGFDWPDAAAVLEKVREELAEVEEVLDGDAHGEVAGDGEAEERGRERPGRERLKEELGDLLFAVANLARHLGVDPEAALAAGNLKFRRRFEGVEERFARRGRSLAEASLEEMDREWEAEKRRRRGSGERAAGDG
jgi:MazG family protein